MKPLIYTFLTLVLLESCASHPESIMTPDGPIAYVLRTASNLKSEQEFIKANKDLLKAIGEPDTLVYRGYIFELTLPYSQYYRFRLEENADSSFTLWSKAWGTATLEPQLPDSIPYRRIHTSPFESRLVESTQPFSLKEVTAFRKLLNCSEYWKWEYAERIDSGVINDGPQWSLESHDETPESNGKIISHWNGTSFAKYSSFTLACLYLVRKSRLLKRLPYLKSYANYYINHKGYP